MDKIRLEVDIPNDILYSLNETKHEFVSQMCFSTALHLFKNHKLSLGKAAELAGMPKFQFIYELNKHNIPIIDYEPEELEEELKGFEEW